MLPVDQMTYHPTSEKLVEVLCSKVQNDNPLFFRVMVGYYFSVVASNMRCTIKTHDRGEIPINMFALNLATSGFGKGHSTNIVEEQTIHLFKKRFKDETYPLLAKDSIARIANQRAIRAGDDPDEVLDRVSKEFESLGPFVFSFDAGSSPAVKQQRHKHLMAEAGALSFKVDEIGLNLADSQEVLKPFLELYDKGRIGQKLTKNFRDNLRNEEIDGAVPTNMLMFGEPSSLLNGGKTEDDFFALLGTGYARRCFFGYVQGHKKNKMQTPEEVYLATTDQSSNLFLEELADKLEALADIINANKKLVMSKETALLVIEYRLQCERAAEQLPDHEGIKKAEMSHRYFKALKLAGAYAFVDDSVELTSEHFYSAIKLAEDAGLAFGKLLTRDRPYVKLAKYIAATKRDITQADLTEDLPFYKGGTAAKTEMLGLAIAYGYKNNIIIKKSFADGIEFLKGETLKETDLNQMVVSYTTNPDMTTDYSNERAPFDKLHMVTQHMGVHWVSHHLNGGYRNEENAIPGFNYVVLDVDGWIPMAMVKALMKDYKALYYTTKSHTAEKNCFRILLPINYELEMDATDFKQFYKNLLEWLPFKAEGESCATRSKKWLSNNGHFEYTEGELLDVLPFIPKTAKNEARKATLNTQQSMDALERWFVNNTGEGNRSNQMIKFALLLVDAGFEFEKVRARVLAFNDKIADKLDEAEILSTVLVSAARAIAKRP